MAKMNQYEAMFLFGPMAATEPETALNLCRKIIEAHEGQIIVLKKWDERKLAYELAGQKRGTYIISYFRAPATAVTPIERDVKLNEEIIRVMVLRVDHLNEQEMNAVEPQPIQPREERPMGDRPSFGGDRGGYGGDRGGDRGGYGGDRGGDRGGYGDRPARPRRDEGAADGAAKD